jgi:hypothetical protein
MLIKTSAFHLKTHKSLAPNYDVNAPFISVPKTIQHSHIAANVLFRALHALSENGNFSKILSNLFSLAQLKQRVQLF